MEKDDVSQITVLIQLYYLLLALAAAAAAA
jgi:hypothetical protein